MIKNLLYLFKYPLSTKHESRFWFFFSELGTADLEWPRLFLRPLVTEFLIKFGAPVLLFGTAAVLIVAPVGVALVEVVFANFVVKTDEGNEQLSVFDCAGCVDELEDDDVDEEDSELVEVGSLVVLFRKNCCPLTRPLSCFDPLLVGCWFCVPNVTELSGDEIDLDIFLLFPFGLDRSTCTFGCCVCCCCLGGEVDGWIADDIGCWSAPAFWLSNFLLFSSFRLDEDMSK